MHGRTLERFFRHSVQAFGVTSPAPLLRLLAAKCAACCCCDAEPVVVDTDAGKLGGPGVELAPRLLLGAPALNACSSISPSVARDRIESRLPSILPGVWLLATPWISVPTQ